MFNSFDILGVIIYGLLANLFYSLGFLIEVVARYYFKNESDFTDRRKLMFGAGLVFEMMITAWLFFSSTFLTTPLTVSPFLK